MIRPSHTEPLRRATLLTAALTVGCLSRWSGCRHYDTGSLAGPGWSARVECAPHTEVHLSNAGPGTGPVLAGCTARWSLRVDHARQREEVALRGPTYPSRDCGEVRQACASAHAALAQRPVSLGTWVAARAPSARTTVVFVPAGCGRPVAQPGDSALSPEAAVAAQPEGAALVDGVIARDIITSHGWRLVCGSVLSSRLAAVRAAMLACRAPEEVARELFALDPASVEAAWEALAAGALPCAERTHVILRQAAAAVLGRAVQRTLDGCARGCEARVHVAALTEAGTLRLPGARAAAEQLATRGPLTRPDPDAYAVWIAAQWALTRIDPDAGVALALATLRRLPAEEGRAEVPSPATEAPPPTGRGDAAEALCAIVAGADLPATRAGLWAIASDEGLGAGARQHALLTLAVFRDARADGATLAHNPLTPAQVALAGAALRGPAPSGGHHHHHHHH